MKRSIIIALLAVCIHTAFAQKSNGLKKIIGKRNGSGATLPLEVVKIPTGTYIPGMGADSNSFARRDQNKPVLLSGYYISEAEITNAQYREFVNWVRDSIAAKKLGGDYIKVIGQDTVINWKKADDINYNNPEVIEKLTDLLIDPARALTQGRYIDPEKLVYLMQGFNYQEAAKKENKGRNPRDFVYAYTVQVYPDTLCWMRDFGYANNEQMATSYFNSIKYQNYPVVGVGWSQANSFCDWFTKHKIYEEQSKKNMPGGGKCRLPTEAEWEYAASLNGDLNKSLPVDTTTSNATDKPIIEQSNKIFPVYARLARKGKMGLYNFADNVSEWTNTSYYQGGENFQNRFNPDIQWGTPASLSRAERRKVTRGGSWKDTPMLTTADNRSFEDLEATHSYLGFRVVIILPEY